MRIAFTKMHGLGNDFVVIDAVSRDIQLSSEQIKKLSHRHFGIGFDQLLLVEPSREPKYDFAYRIYNQDGSEVENCGNGARCFARFVRERKLTAKSEIRVQTSKSSMRLTVHDDHSVSVDMGMPILSPQEIPIDASNQQLFYDIAIDVSPLKHSERKRLVGVVESGALHNAKMIDADTLSVSFCAISMGNPHAVFFVDELEEFPVDVLGPIVESHPFFPNKVNVGFLQIHSRDRASLRVYERGAGETIACGTGACAAATAGIISEQLNSTVDIELRGGTLHIAWPAATQSLFMQGPAENVFYGHVHI